VSEMNRVSYERETDRKTEGVRDRWSEGEREGYGKERGERLTDRQKEKTIGDRQRGIIVSSW